MRTRILFFWVCLVIGFFTEVNAQSKIPEPTLEFLFEENVLLEPAQELGVTTYGNRRIINIVGGTFEGPKLKGKILRGGADWQTVREDGTADLVAQYTLQTDDGALIYIVNKGVRHASPEVLQRMKNGEDVDPSEYYMRTAATFETSHEKYKWLNKIIAVASGARLADEVIIRFYQVN
ncbi:DUF3237 domain-containing protein [Maribacter cobaltidurans]|uniref:UPF0311 protein CJ263_16345 n=1 Tax=Maribacter cobaltidurans TaxID=1178778 RepID=A0A223V8S5_9FLAO|nr:DUF3237 domain-containing protein [Maribacter cobaltidurans]ASV31657.1 hypothetical protein CJ263_16345 [Maribacter cobaltidurans]GGD94050.1 UPF0311 protein [Maribacter cobaltidurans]